MDTKSKRLSENQKNWIYFILLILVPFIIVHIFNSFESRLASILWIVTIFPSVLIFLLLTNKKIIRLKNYSNQKIEGRLTIFANLGGVFLTVLVIWFVAIPAWLGTYDFYIRHIPPIVIEDTVNGTTAPLFGLGIFHNLKLSHDSDHSYWYFIPTIFRFGDSKFNFTILPGTHFILDVKPE